MTQKRTDNLGNKGKKILISVLRGIIEDAASENKIKLLKKEQPENKKFGGYLKQIERFKKPVRVLYIRI